MWQERRTTTAAANNASLDTQEDTASTPSEPGEDEGVEDLPTTTSDSEEEENAASPALANPNITVTVPHRQLDPYTSTIAISKVGGRKRRKGSRSTASVEGLTLN